MSYDVAAASLSKVLCIFLFLLSQLRAELVVFPLSAAEKENSKAPAPLSSA